MLLLPGILTVYLSFNSGGFFPGTVGFAATCVALALIAKITLSRRPFDGLSLPGAVIASSLALFAGWVALSSSWSDAQGRALLELDRVVLYLFVFLLFASLGRTSWRIQRIVEGIAAAIALVCLCALVTRLLPDVWPVTLGLAPNRLGYPLGYWNGLGILAAIGGVLALYLATSLRAPLPQRILASAVLPAIAVTLYFTFSRGAIAASIVGALAYLILGRPRGGVGGLLAVGPTTVIAVTTAYDADLLATGDPAAAAAVGQGHDVALVVGLCCLAAGIARGLLLWLDRRVYGFHLPAHLRRRVLGAAWGSAACAAVVIFLAFGGAQEVGRQYDRFVRGEAVGTSSDLRTRLLDPGNNGRLETWEVAMDGFRDASFHGQGAGTYEVVWARQRPSEGTVTDAHSVYLEVLSELGLVGAALLAVWGGTLLYVLAARIRKPHRSLYAAIMAAALMWVLHAGVDWDWEMPAVTVWLFALGGAASAKGANRSSRAIDAPGDLWRLGVGTVCLAVAAVPTLVALSQGHLTDSVDAFKRGDCRAATAAARSSISTLDVRAEPWEVIGYCAIRRGDGRLAAHAMEQGVKRDPRYYLWHYGLAVGRGAADLDPRPAARAAVRLNPFDPLAQDARRRFATNDRRLWVRRARTATVPALFRR